MIYYDRIDVNNTSESKECDVCLYWYFLNKDFYVSNSCMQYGAWFINNVYEP